MQICDMLLNWADLQCDFVRNVFVGRNWLISFTNNGFKVCQRKKMKICYVVHRCRSRLKILFFLEMFRKNMYRRKRRYFE